MLYRWKFYMSEQHWIIFQEVNQQDASYYQYALLFFLLLTSAL